MRDQEIVGLYEAYQSIYSNVNEEVEAWVNALVEEGYDLSEYTWDDMCEMYMNLDEDSRRTSNAQHAKRVRGNIKSFGSSYTPPKNWDPEANRGQGAVLRPKQVEKKRRKALVNAELNREQVDFFDTILEYLVAEGYADTNEAAIKIMANMSEEWRQSIVEADSIEAMRARAAKRRKQRYGASDTSRGGRDDFKPITDYEEADKKWARPGKPDKG